MSTNDTTTTTETTETKTDETTTDWKAEAEKWKGLADSTDKRVKRLEDTAKANATAAKELETLKQSTMTETEKAVNQAKLEVRNDVMREVGGKLAEAQIRIAAAGRAVDVDALIDGIDASKFLDANGDPDTKAITAWVDKVAPASDDGLGIPKQRDLGLGARGAQQSAQTPASAFGKFIGDALKT